MKRTIILFIAFSIILSFFLAGCGGGGSSASLSGNGAETGQVALLVTDGPSDDYDHIWIEITRVLMLPSAPRIIGPSVVMITFS